MKNINVLLISSPQEIVTNSSLLQPLSLLNELLRDKIFNGEIIKIKTDEINKILEDADAAFNLILMSEQAITTTVLQTLRAVELDRGFSPALVVLIANNLYKPDVKQKKYPNLIITTPLNLISVETLLELAQEFNQSYETEVTALYKDTQDKKQLRRIGFFDAVNCDLFNPADMRAAKQEFFDIYCNKRLTQCFDMKLAEYPKKALSYKH